MVSASSLLLAFSAIVGSFAAPTPVDELDLVLTARNLTDLVKRQDYTQNYQTTGNVQFAASTTGFEVDFQNAQDFVVGRGWSTGAAR